jgi:hypothetical protein
MKKPPALGPAAFPDRLSTGGDGQETSRNPVRNQGDSQQPNRASRRREEVERRRRKEIWRHLIRQGGGAYNVTIWRIDGATPDYAACGAICSWVEAVASGALDPQCLTCDARPKPPAAFSILAPLVATPEALSVSAICPACAARSDDDLIEGAGAALKRHIFPDARRLDPAHMQHAGGRA